MTEDRCPRCNRPYIPAGGDVRDLTYCWQSKPDDQDVMFESIKQGHVKEKECIEFLLSLVESERQHVALLYKELNFLLSKSNAISSEDTNRLIALLNQRMRKQYSCKGL